jgi:hypothetical protein
MSGVQARGILPNSSAVRPNAMSVAMDFLPITFANRPKAFPNQNWH